MSRTYTLATGVVPSHAHGGGSGAQNTVDNKTKRMEQALNRSIILVFWYKANTEPLRLNYEVPTFPMFELAGFPSLVTDLGLTSTSFIDAWNPTSGHFEQHMIDTARVVEGGQRLLYKMRKSLLDGLKDDDCPGLVSELNLQSQDVSSIRSVTLSSASIPPSTPLASSSGVPIPATTVAPSVIPTTIPYAPSARITKRPAVDIPGGQAPPSKYFISDSYNHSNSYDDDDERFESHADNPFAPGSVPASSSATATAATALPPLHTTSSSLADAVRSPTLSTPLTARSAGLQTAPAHSSHTHTHTTHSSPHTPSAHIPRVRHGGPKLSHQTLTTYAYGPSAGTYNTSSELDSSSASSAASSSIASSSAPSAASSSSSSSTSTPSSPLPQYLLSQPSTSAIPYHAHPPMKRWPNDFTVSEITRGFRFVDRLVADTPAYTQRAAFERVFGCRYVKSTVCRHRGVWRRADEVLRKRFEDMGDGVEAAMWGEFVRRVEGKPTMLEGGAGTGGDANRSGTGGGSGSNGAGHHNAHNHQPRQSHQHHSPHPQGQSGHSGHSGHHRSGPREVGNGNAYDAEDEEEVPQRPPGLAPVFASSGGGDSTHTSHGSSNGGGPGSGHGHGHGGHSHNSSAGSSGHGQNTHSGGHGQGHHQNLMVHSAVHINNTISAIHPSRHLSVYEHNIGRV